MVAIVAFSTMAFGKIAQENGFEKDPLISLAPTAEQLNRAKKEAYNFEGIVGLSNCSGAIVRYERSSDDDFAMVLTNGHCLHGGMPRPGEVRVNRSSNRSFRVLDASANRLGQVRAQRLIYGTMTKTDMAIFELRKTFREIAREFGVRPLTLSSTMARNNDAIEIISGYWRRGFSCRVERFVDTLEEGGWVWKQSLRYSRPGCEIYGGTSGSPIVLTGSRTVVGVNNTANERGRWCTINNPCEIDKDGQKTVEKGVGYGQQTVWIYSCLDENNQLDLQRQGCLLPK